jgi:asparagine synthase (glutamine-hydrolysing)
MCGICGVFNYQTKKIADKTILTKMCQEMFHRGPDDGDIYLSNELGLGHRRLSIIDLAGGHQPMHNEDRTVWIVFNGEIYNFKDLRVTLESQGHHFYTNSDTEVIIHAYEEYGEECVQHFQGMFAFGIWDDRKKKLLLARDRVGIKPLYYFNHEGRLIFASEIKAIIKDPTVPRALDTHSLDHFLTFGYTSITQSMFKHIEKLPPGHIMICQDGNVSSKQYWDLMFTRNGHESSSYYIEKTKELLTDSVKKKLQSDVPLGAFLSGGLDSSTIVGLMHELGSQPVKTFSVGFDVQQFSELNYARLVADHFHTDHHELIMTAKDYQAFFPKFIWHQDEPLNDPSSIAFSYLAKLAKESVTVILSGEGSDEIFAGYERYLGEKIALYVNHVPAPIREKWLMPIAKHFQHSRRWRKLFGCIGTESFEDRFVSLRTINTLASKENILSEEYRSSFDDKPYVDILSYYMQKQPFQNNLNRMQYLDTKVWLVEDMLMKKDKMGMAASIEARVPFLDHHLVEFAATIPIHLKIRGFSTKHILKKIMTDTLPKAIIKRPKMGFPVPLNDWFRTDLKECLADTLLSTRMKERGIFNPNHIHHLFKDHLSGEQNHGLLLFQLLCFESWCQTYLDNGMN